MTSSRRTLGAACLALVLALTACSSDSGADADRATDTASDTEASPDDTPTSTTGSNDTLHILVTNDDGVDAEGIDVVATALSELPDTEVTVVAPADEQSGTGANTTEGPLTARTATTASGYEAMAVDGFPADSVAWALEEGDLATTPDLVVSGINSAQNLGPVTALSGTVGAAREAARRGIPALSASSGVVNLGGDPVVEYDVTVDLVVEWVEAHRGELLGRGHSTEPADVANLNVPTCVTGEPRGQVEVPIAEDTGGLNIFETDCESTLEAPPDDVVAFVNGFASLSELNVTELDALIERVIAGNT